MSIYANVDGAQKELDTILFNKGGTSKSLGYVYGNVDGVQKELYPTYKEVLASSLSAGDSFWLEDTEGLSEYVVTDGSTDFDLFVGYATWTSDVGCIPAIRVNALDVNIVSAISDHVVCVQPGYEGWTDYVNELDYVVSYSNWAKSTGAVNIQPYTYNGYNGLGGSYYVFLGLEDLKRDSSNYYRVGWLLLRDSSELSRVVNTKTKSNVLCFYNSGSYEDLIGTIEYVDENGDTQYGEYEYDESRLYYYKGGKISGSTTIQYNYEESGVITHNGFPSELYFRPTLLFRGDINVLVRT